MFFWLLPFLSALSPMFQLRLLRTLPFRTGQIAALVLGAPIILSVFVWLALVMAGFLLFGETSPARLAMNACGVIFVFMVAIPMALRWGLGMGSCAGMLGVVMAVIIVPEALGAYLSLGIVALATAMAIAGSWFLSYRLLSRSSAPYRGEIIRFPGMPTGS